MPTDSKAPTQAQLLTEIRDLLAGTPPSDEPPDSDFDLFIPLTGGGHQAVRTSAITSYTITPRGRLRLDTGGVKAVEVEDQHVIPVLQLLGDEIAAEMVARERGDH